MQNNRTDTSLSGSAPLDVFLSAVTSEFGRARDVVANDLQAKGYTVTVQQDFRQEGDSSTTLEKLDNYIRQCEAVVCIIGTRSGSVPSDAEAAPFAEYLPPTLERASYVQWELILARHYQKKLWLFHANPEFVPDQPDPIGEDHPDLQARFVDWLFGREGLGLGRDQFSDPNELQLRVLLTDLGTGTVVGERRAANRLDAGLDVPERGAPKPRRKDPADAYRLPPNRHPLYGREDELEEVLEAIDGRYENLILLVGEAGIGKRALLQELTHSERLPTDFADGAGIHLALTGDEDGEDLRQAIWDQFYEAEDPSTVAPRQRLKDLQDLEALLIIPDIDRLVEHLPDLLDDVPGIYICASISSDAIDEWTEALQASEDIFIGGLTDEDEMLALFEDRYRTEVPAAARQHIVDLCVEQGGNPAKIERLAADARREARPPRTPEPGAEHPLVAWAAGQHSAGAPAEQIRTLEVTQTVGTEVPRDVLARAGGSAEAIDEAVRDGNLEEG